MTKIKILVKNYLNQFIGSIKWRKRKGKVVAATSMISISVAVIIGAFFYQAYTFYSLIGPEYGIMTGTSMILMLTILATITRSLTPSQSTDTELLLSMPIKKSHIVISHSVSKYIFELITVLLFFFPYATLYLIMGKFSVLSLLGAILVILLLPLLSVGFSYILSTIINLIGSKFRYTNIIKIVCTLIITVFIALTFSSTNTSMIEIIYPAVWMRDIVVSFDLLSLLYLLLLVTIPFVIGIYLFSRSFGVPKAKYVSSNKTLKFKQRHPLQTLILKEGRRYLSSPIYVINTIVGPLFILGITIFTIVKENALDIIFNQLPAEYMVFKPYAILAFLIFTIGMTAVSASSISLEGKNIWILQANPIPHQTIFLAKAGFNFLLVAPVSVISLMILKFTLGFTLLQTLILIVVAILVSLFTGLSGLLINLWFPKMEWTNDMVVVKQSLSVFLAILPAMIIPVLIFIPLILEPSIKFELYGPIIGLVYAGLNVLVWKLLMKSGVKAFNQL